MRVIQKAALLLVGVAGCQPALSGAPTPAVTPTPVTLRQVMTMQALVGETVVVTGRCLGTSAQQVARGRQPISGRDWQFEDDGVAVWVSGPMPEGCGTGSEPAVAITARVVQDSLPRLSRPRMVRQYLVMR